MPKFRVTLSDDRTVDAFAPDEDGAKAQARHHEWSRYDIGVRRGQTDIVRPADPVAVVKVKD